MKRLWALAAFLLAAPSLAAVRLVTSTTNMTGSGGHCKKSEAASLQFSNNSFDDVNTARTVSGQTVTTGVTLQGAYLMLHRTGTTGAFTVTLQDNGSDVAGSSYTAVVSSIDSKDSANYYPFNTGFVALAGHTYGLKVQSTAASNLAWIRNSGAGTYSFAIIGNGDDTTGVTNLDTVLLSSGIALYQDMNLTLTTSGSFPGVLGDGATWYVINSSSLSYSGTLFSPSDTCFQMGLSTSPVFGAAIGHTAGGPLFTTQSNGSTADFRQSFLFYGTTYYDMTVLTATAAVTTNVVNLLAAVPPSWQDGDMVEFWGKTNLASDNVQYWMKKTGTAQISLYTTPALSVVKNLDASLGYGGAVVNVYRSTQTLGITITDSNTSTNQLLAGMAYGRAVLNGIYAPSTRINMGQAQGALASSGQSILCTVSDGNGFIIGGFNSTVVPGTFDNIVIKNGAGSDVVTPGVTFDGNGLTATRIRIKNFGQSDYNNAASVGANTPLNSDQVFNDFVISNPGGNGRFSSFHFMGYNLQASTITVIGANAFFNCFSSKFTNFNANYGITNANFQANLGLQFVNSTFGSMGATSSSDINFYIRSENQVLFSSSSIGSKGFLAYDNINQINIPYQSALTAQSYLQWHSYNGTLNDNRTFKAYGTFTTDAPSYTDLVQVSSPTQTLEHDFGLLSQNIANFKHYFTVYGQINSANYYSGSFVLPSVGVFMDGHLTTGSADATASLAASTALQSINTSFTPTTNNNTLALAFETNTDQTQGANSEVTWSSAAIVQRNYGYKYTTLSLGITETLTYPIATITTPVTDSFVSASLGTAATYDANLFSWNGTTLTVVANATVQQAYDWSRYYLQLSTQIATTDFLTTVDGNNFTLSGNLVVNNGVTFTGTSSQRYALGSSTLTLTGTGTTSGVIVTDWQGTHAPLTLSNLVANSTVYVHDLTAGATIYKAVVAGTSLTTFVTLSSDHNLDVIRVRKAGEIPYETNGTLGINGLSITVNQTADTVYTGNNIDGSTVSEFAFTGTVIEVFINAGSNQTSGQRLYNWYQWALSQTTWINLQPNDITAQTTSSYVLADALTLCNQQSTPLFITGANLTNTSNNGQIINTGAGCYSINVNGFFPFQSGSDVGTAVWDDPNALTVGKFLGLK